MPKGWKRLDDQNGNVYEFQPAKMVLDTYDALELLKEMAEAIEMGLKYEDCPVNNPCKIYGHDEMRLVLKKFKEWK